MIPLFYSLLAQVILWSRIILVSQRESAHDGKSQQKKPLCQDRDLNPWTLSPEPSVLFIRPWRPAFYTSLNSPPMYPLPLPDPYHFSHPLWTCRNYKTSINFLPAFKHPHSLRGGTAWNSG